MIGSRFFIFPALVAVSLISNVAAQSCETYAEPILNCPAGFTQKPGTSSKSSLGSHANKLGHIYSLTSFISHLAGCSRACTTEQAASLAASEAEERCENNISACLNVLNFTPSSTGLPPCNYAFANCLPQLPLCLCATRLDEYVINETKDQCERRT